MGIQNNLRPLSAWKRTLLFGCALWLALACPFAAATFPAEYILFKPQPYLNALEQSGFYRNYPALMLDFIGAGGDLFVPGMGRAVLGFLQAQNAENVLRFVFPQDWVSTQTEKTLRNFWAYYNYEARELNLSVDLLPVKAHLTGTAARTLISDTMAGWPDCSAENILQIGLLLLKGETDNLPRCRPPQLLENGMLGGLELGLQSFAQSLPEQVWLLPRQAGEIRGPYHTFRYGLRFAPAGLVLICLGAAGLLGFSGRRFWAWLGLPLYSGGLLTALLAALAGWLIGWLLPMPAGLFPGPAAQLYQFFSTVLLRVGTDFLIAMALLGLGLAVVGLGLRLLGRRLLNEGDPTSW
jgi:hypothetical protein